MAAAWCGRPLLAGVTAVLIGSAHAQPVPACYKKTQNFNYALNLLSDALGFPS